MKSYSAKEAATELGTDGRTLRRFLRSDASGFTPVGSGGKYEFSTSDMPKLKDAFSKWNTRPSRNATKHNTDGTLVDDRPGLSARQAKDPKAVRAITKQRVDALEAALISKGLHISQMKDRDTWRRVKPASEKAAV